MQRDIQRRSLSLLVVLTCALPAASASAQLEFEREPINYTTASPGDRVALLQQKLEAEEVTLKYDDEHGYLAALLDYLEVPLSSQTLVFSKTSLQRHRISPRTPRALYFNDDIYVGWVQNGDVIELSAVDPQLGAVFYTLDQRNEKTAAIRRQTDNCLICHASTHTSRVPGHIMRSVFVDSSGLPRLSSGTYRTNDSSPLKDRWGGWYVSGTHGRQRHMGNAITRGIRGPEDLDREVGANVTDLKSRVDTDPYLTSHSDLVALMVLAHQTAVHNQLTAANFSGRFTARDTDVMNEALDRPDDYESDTTKRRYASAAEKVVKALLLTDEHQLTDEVAGSSGFEAEFSSRGPFDDRGRSLRQLDLKRRLFRFPCSFLIYSEAFDSLPPRVLSIVYRRLFEVLTGADQSEEFSHLTPADRQAILEILTDTKEGLPEYWHDDNPAAQAD